MVDADSIDYYYDGEQRTPELQTFLLEFRAQLGISDDVLPVYLEEIASTLSAIAFKLCHRTQDARLLALADYQIIERGMSFRLFLDASESQRSLLARW